MGDILVFLVLATVVIVAFIELFPTKLDLFAKILAAALITLLGTGWLPAWYGWLAAAVGVAYGGWICLSLQRPQGSPDPLFETLRWAERVWLRLVERAVACAPRLAVRAGASAAAALRAVVRQRWVNGENMARALVLIVTSPIAAAPVTLTLMLVLISLGVDVAGAEREAPELLRYVLGTSFFTWLAALDGAVGNAAVAVPVLLGTALVGVVVAGRCERGMPVYLGVWLLLGAVYPGLLFAQELLGSGREPLFT